jgi:hypothetical protein
MRTSIRGPTSTQLASHRHRTQPHPHFPRRPRARPCLHALHEATGRPVWPPAPDPQTTARRQKTNPEGTPERSRQLCVCVGGFAGLGLRGAGLRVLGLRWWDSGGGPTAAILARLGTVGHGVARRGAVWYGRGSFWGGAFAPHERRRQALTTWCHKWKCLACGLHAEALSWRAEWRPAFCPECGARTTT